MAIVSYLLPKSKCPTHIYTMKNVAGIYTDRRGRWCIVANGVKHIFPKDNITFFAIRQEDINSIEYPEEIYISPREEAYFNLRINGSYNDINSLYSLLEQNNYVIY